MQIGLVGLGKMGAGIARRLCRADIHVVGCDGGCGRRGERSPTSRDSQPRHSLDALLLALPAPRTVWCMLPAGEPTRSTLDELARKLAPGDCVVDGANGHYREAMARAGRFAASGIGFVDAGVSGGIWGLANGYALMLGGNGTDIAALRARLPGARARTGTMAALRPGGRGPLREDDPQRHRVRADAGLRRRLRPPAGPPGLRPGSRGHRRQLAQGERGALVAPRAHA